jgi:hypothetical protein
MRRERWSEGLSEEILEAEIERFWTKWHRLADPEGYSAVTKWGSNWYRYRPLYFNLFPGVLIAAIAFFGFTAGVVPREAGLLVFFSPQVGAMRIIAYIANMVYRAPRYRSMALRYDAGVQAIKERRLPASLLAGLAERAPLGLDPVEMAAGLRGRDPVAIERMQRQLDTWDELRQEKTGDTVRRLTWLLPVPTLLLAAYGYWTGDGDVVGIALVVVPLLYLLAVVSQRLGW